MRWSSRGWRCGVPDRVVRFDEAGLVPAVVQHAQTGEVLMLAWMNQEALDATTQTGQVHFWSRSRQELWRKGATSGHTMACTSLSTDCDGDTVLVRVLPEGPACHTGSRTCFAPEEPAPQGFADLEQLWATVEQRLTAETSSDRSYTAALAAGGVESTGAKVTEEAAEVVEAAGLHRDGAVDDLRVAEEAADLVYHLLVLLAERGVRPAAVMEVLRSRRPARTGR